MCIQKLFGISPSNLPIYYSSKGLLPWEGGATWGTHIHIHPRFEKKATCYFGLYSRSEIIAHEMVHALRAHLDEPLFEEMLAYQTATKPWRRWLGPLFSSTREAWAVIVSSCLTPCLIYFNQAPIAFAIGLTCFGWIGIRAYIKHRQFAACRKKYGLARMLFMTDEEIILRNLKGHTEPQVS